jgi:hypothetical protein
MTVLVQGRNCQPHAVLRARQRKISKKQFSALPAKAGNHVPAVTAAASWVPTFVGIAELERFTRLDF